MWYIFIAIMLRCDAPEIQAIQPGYLTEEICISAMKERSKDYPSAKMECKYVLR